MSPAPIAGNSATTIGRGIHSPSGAVTARNTIIAPNTAPSGADFSGPLISQGFNLIGNSSGATITPAQFSDQIGTSGSPIDPQLGPLQDNGGPTLTRALLSGSTAIDKGDSSGSPSDQRGLARPSDLPLIPNAAGGDGADIGAFEVQASGSGVDINQHGLTGSWYQSTTDGQGFELEVFHNLNAPGNRVRR